LLILKERQGTLKGRKKYFLREVLLSFVWKRVPVF
jgi:hypothetical protein